MSREASTPVKTGKIFGMLSSPQCKAIARLFYEKNGVWVLEENLNEDAGIDWTAAGEMFDYSNINLVPAASTISFSINNFQGQYSPGSGTPLDSVYDLNTRVKLEAGYIVDGLEEWVYQSVFYIDSPEYSDPTAPEIPQISCTGRDAFKFAQEKSINLFDLSTGYKIDALIKLICDQIGILYSVDSIEDLSMFGDRTLSDGLKSVKKASDVFGIIMPILNQIGFGKYLMFIRYDADLNDNILYVQQRKTDYTNLFVFNRNNTATIGSKKKNYDRLMQRISFFTKKNNIEAEVLLGQDTFTSAGLHSITWVGKAAYKRYEVTVNSGTVDVELDSSSPVDPTAINFNLIGATFSVTIKVFGSHWDTDPTFQGESINNANMLAMLGRTFDPENELIESDAEARRMAEGFIRDYGNPKYEVGDLTWPYLHLMLDQNDVGFIWSDITFIYTLYFVTNLSHHWDRHNDSTTYTMVDSGVTFNDVGNLKYDGGTERYDVGWQYDMVFGPGAPPDVTDYNYLLPVLAT